MNTYDPATLILYVHVGGGTDPSSTPSDGGRTCHPLPPGYANRSPRTYLGSTGRSGGRSSRRRHEQDEPGASVQPLSRETSLPPARTARAARRPG